VTKIRQRVPVEDYLRPQRRFAHLFGPNGDHEALERIRQQAERYIRQYQSLDTQTPGVTS
jgi:pyruvate ferredoxin oxidoreductase beta subunit